MTFLVGLEGGSTNLIRLIAYSFYVHINFIYYDKHQAATTYYWPEKNYKSPS